MDNTLLTGRLIAHEGMKKFAYQDSKGYWSVGIGRCIDSKIGRGLSIDEQMYLLNNDIKLCGQQLSTHKFYTIQDIVRQEALIELCFNMGIDKLLKFAKMLAAFSAKDYKRAAAELVDSLWAIQVQPERVKDLVYRIEHGSYSP